VLNNTKTQSRPKLLFLVPAISQTPKVLKILKTFLSRARPRPRLYFLFSRRLETKTLVSRTTSLPVCGCVSVYVGGESVEHVGKSTYGERVGFTATFCHPTAATSAAAAATTATTTTTTRVQLVKNSRTVSVLVVVRCSSSILVYTLSQKTTPLRFSDITSSKLL